MSGQQFNVPLSERYAVALRQLTLRDDRSVPETLRPAEEAFLEYELEQDRDLATAVFEEDLTYWRAHDRQGHPKNDEPRTLIVRDDLLFPSSETSGGRPLSRNTFRTRVWLPALAQAELGFHVRMDDLRHAHASWLLAGGADLKSVMDRLGPQPRPKD